MCLFIFRECPPLVTHGSSVRGSLQTPPPLLRLLSRGAAVQDGCWSREPWRGAGCCRLQGNGRYDGGGDKTQTGCTRKSELLIFCLVCFCMYMDWTYLLFNVTASACAYFVPDGIITSLSSFSTGGAVLRAGGVWTFTWRWAPVSQV